MKNMKIDANGTEIRVMGDVVNEDAYISLTDIAFEFASWISLEFKLYIIKEHQRLKKDEANRLAIGWDAKRELSKINYRIHTDAVKEYLITPTLSTQEMAYTYASEADILNMALFGKTAAQWRNEKGISGKTPNIRDYASAEELVLTRLGIPMSTAIDMYLNQISLTGGIPFAVTLPKAPSSLNADLMTKEEIHKKLQEGYDDIHAGRVQDAYIATQ